MAGDRNLRHDLGRRVQSREWVTRRREIDRRWERILTPFVDAPMSIHKPEQLEGLARRLISDESLRIALTVATRVGRRFNLRPAPKDW